MLEKQKDVVVALPFADASRVEVWASKRQALTEKSVKDLIELDKFKLVGFAARPYPASEPAPGKKGGGEKGAKPKKARVGAGGDAR